MLSPITIELTSLLAAETLERLQLEAERQQMTLSELVREAVEDYVEELDDEEEYEDTPDEKIIADFKEAWHQAMTGAPTRPVEELFAEARRELAEDGDQS